MKARIFFSLGLLLLVVLVFAVLLLNPKEVDDTGISSVSSVDAQATRRIEITRGQQAPLVLEKEAAGWMIVSPILARANPDRVESMLGIVKATSHTRIAADRDRLGTFGLDPAQVVLRLDQYEFVFGNTDPIDERRYLYFDGIVHLVDDGLFHQLKQKPEFFVSTRLVPGEETISAMRTEDLLLEKKGNRWSMQPLQAGLDSAGLAAIVDNWKQARARRILPYTAGRQAQSIQLTLASGRVIRYELVQEEPVFVLGRADLGLQYQFEAGVASLLLPSADPG